MADKKEIQACYDWFDPFHVLCLGGEYTDVTGAFFNGNFSMPLERAQEEKHNWILYNIGFWQGETILDIGCGRGPMLNRIRELRGKGIGFTLSDWQARYCQERGLDARLQDYKTADPVQIGQVSGVVSVGALEHFCSVDEFRQGKQEEIYRNFFKFCAEVLPRGAKLFLQTMVWGKRVPNPDGISLDAPEGSDEKILARTTRFYPGSWLPSGKEQLIQCASPYFNFLFSNNGRLDYIETLNRWGERIPRLWKTKAIVPASVLALKLLPRYLTSEDFRQQVAFLTHGDQKECFEREVMSHERMFFQKI